MSVSYPAKCFFWVSFGLSMVACLFSFLYNSTSIDALHFLGHPVPYLPKLFGVLDLWMFLIPLLSAFVLRRVKTGDKLVLVFAVVLVCFSYLWPLLVLLVWRISETPVVGLN